MDSNEQVLTVFQTRIRQLILRYKQLDKENSEFYTMVSEAERNIKELREELERKTNDYDSLKMARMIAVSDGDIEAARARLSKLIRDVNKCIAVLTEQK